VTFNKLSHRISKELDLYSGKNYLWPYTLGKFYPNRW